MEKGNNTAPERVDTFFHIFMFELEALLKAHRQDMQNISFQSDEANTDRPLKEYLKSFIMKNITSIPSNKYNNMLNIIHTDDTGKTERITYRYGDFADISIIDVLLPDEVPDDYKKIIAESKTSVYTNPDLLFVIIDKDGNRLFQSIELKSTKEDSIPGSSVQQVNPLEWVLFVKHNEKGVYITTGQYVNSINSRLQFPDRSPRPQVSYKELEKWNRDNRYADNNSLVYVKSYCDTVEKLQLILDWQSFLANRWLEIVKASNIKANEPWFNNALRKFVLKFIGFYEELSDKEKSNFRSVIKKLIQG
jgi:hypothetical protein